MSSGCRSHSLFDFVPHSQAWLGGKTTGKKSPIKKMIKLKKMHYPVIALKDVKDVTCRPKGPKAGPKGRNLEGGPLDF